MAHTCTYVRWDQAYRIAAPSTQKKIKCFDLLQSEATISISEGLSLDLKIMYRYHNMAAVVVEEATNQSIADIKNK